MNWYATQTLVAPPHTSHLTMLCKFRQTYVADSVYSVVILVLGLVGVVSILIFSPLVRPEVRNQSLRSACNVQAITFQYIQARYYAIVALCAWCHP